MAVRVSPLPRYINNASEHASANTSAKITSFFQSTTAIATIAGHNVNQSAKTHLNTKPVVGLVVVIYVIINI